MNIHDDVPPPQEGSNVLQPTSLAALGGQGVWLAEVLKAFRTQAKRRNQHCWEWRISNQVKLFRKTQSDLPEPIVVKVLTTDGWEFAGFLKPSDPIFGNRARYDANASRQELHAIAYEALIAKGKECF